MKQRSNAGTDASLNARLHAGSRTIWLTGLIGMGASFLTACPIYDEQAYEASGTGSGPDYIYECYGPSDCQLNETCGSDYQCHPGDCTYWGCPGGYDCEIQSDRTAACVDNAGASSTTGTSGGGGGDGEPTPTYCGNPDDCTTGENCTPTGICEAGSCEQTGCIAGFACGADGTCVAEDANACGSDADCNDLGAGYLCVSGQCTAPEDQCFDQTQCDAGKSCVAGKCIATCQTDADCPDEHSLCDTSIGVCSTPATTCSVSADCSDANLVCVDGGCVPRSDDGACPEGFVWVENGCIPNQSPTFICETDGAQDACEAGSICLHHSCYISCSSPNENACDSLTSFDECKVVVTSSGEHPVCGSAENLGGECDPTAGISCANGGICIDGFCK